MSTSPAFFLPFDVAQLVTLYRLGQLVRASLDLDATLAAIADAACELTAAEQSAIMLLNEQDELVLRVGRGAVSAAIGERVPAGAGIVGRALRQRRVVLVPDMQSEPERARPDLDARSGVRAYIAAPLIWDETILGVVTVASTAPSALKSVDAALVDELAQQAAAAVTHARAYAREQAQRAETEALNRQLEERTRQLERAQRQFVEVEKLTAIGQLANGIAHELNTPLGVIVSNLAVLEEYGTALKDSAHATGEAVALLQQGEPPATVATALAGANRLADLEYILDDLPKLTAESSACANRIAEIVRSVATFGRSGPDDCSTTSVEDALESAITLVWGELKHRARVIRRYSAVESVRGHLPDLAQVFVHLLLNAAQALEQVDGVVDLTIEQEGDAVVVIVTDNGCGIAPEHLPRVFEPFFTTRDPGQGSGMGLAVCHGIVAGLGGSVHVESDPGAGTSAVVRLPVAGSGREAVAA